MGGEAYVLDNDRPKAEPSEQFLIVVGQTMSGETCAQWAPNPETYTCAVTDPHKGSKFKGIKSFIEYNLTPSFSNIQVSRRYKRFDWLYTRLRLKFICCNIPPLPDKQVAGRYEETFIQTRMRQLQAWMGRMCEHPVISRSQLMHGFLSVTDEKDWKKFKRLSEKDEYIGGKFFYSIQVPSPAIPNWEPLEVEKSLESFNGFIKCFEENVSQCTAATQRQYKNFTGALKQEFVKFGNAISGVGEAFKKDPRTEAQKMARGYELAGRCYENISTIYGEQPANDLLAFSEQLDAYKGLLSSLPEVYHAHKGAITTLVQLQKTGCTPDEQASAVDQVARIGYAVNAEIDLFQRQRYRDFTNFMADFLRAQIHFYAKIKAELETTLQQFESL